RNPFDEPEIVRGDLVGLLEPGDVLAQTSEHHRDPVFLEVFAGAKRGFGVLAGHEAKDSAPGESKPGQVVAEPPVRRHPQENPAHPYLGQSLNRGRDRYLMSFLTTRTNRASLSPHVGSRRARASDRRASRRRDRSSVTSFFSAA